MKTSDLGCGAHLGGVPIEWEELLATLRASRSFQRYYGRNLILPGLGHLMCELRQNLKKKNLADLAAFVSGYGDVPETRCQRSDADKRAAAERIAEYALPLRERFL